jgi:AcrR family transcriptional regulator
MNASTGAGSLRIRDVTGTRLTRDERKEQTRERLLQAAERVFAERGYHAASVDEVAEQAGFSTGALYSNFEGKEDLFLTLFDRHITRQSAEIAALIEDLPSVDERARIGAEHWVEFLDREAKTVMLFIEFWSFAVRNPDVRSRFAERYGRIREVMTGLIARGAQDLGVELSIPPEQLAVVVDALADGIALQKLVDPGSVPDDLFGRALIMLFEGAMKPSAVNG